MVYICMTLISAYIAGRNIHLYKYAVKNKFQTGRLFIDWIM